MANKRKDLTLAEKIHVLDQIKTYKTRPSTRQLSEDLKVPKTTLVTLLQKEEQLRSEFQICKTSGKRKRNGKNPEIEDALKSWFQIIESRGGRMTGPLLKEKAEMFARELNYPEFKATSGWLSRWKVREGIKFKRAHGEKAEFLENDLDTMSITNEGVNPEAFLEVNLQCYDENETNLVKEIVESIERGRTANKVNDCNEEALMQETHVEMISHDSATKCIEQLRLYFMQEGNENSPRYELDVCRDFVASKST